MFYKNPTIFIQKKHLPKNPPHFSPFYFLIPALKTVFFSPNGVVSHLILSLKTFDLVMEAFEMSLHIGQGFPVEDGCCRGWVGWLVGWLVLLLLF